MVFGASYIRRPARGELEQVMGKKAAHFLEVGEEAELVDVERISDGGQRDGGTEVTYIERLWATMFFGWRSVRYDRRQTYNNISDLARQLMRFVTTGSQSVSFDASMMVCISVVQEKRSGGKTDRTKSVRLDPVWRAGRITPMRARRESTTKYSAWDKTPAMRSKCSTHLCSARYRIRSERWQTWKVSLWNRVRIEVTHAPRTFLFRSWLWFSGTPVAVSVNRRLACIGNRRG
jgi:hypothetical protein